MNTAHLRFPLAIVAVLLMLPQLGGCATTTSAKDSLDSQRNGALAVFVNRKVNDSINVPDGDDVDWKYVDINKSGMMQVAVAFDEPDRVAGEVVLRDNFATIIERQPINAGRAFYAFEAVNAVRGRYYIEIRGDDGASVYTVGVTLDEPNFGVSVIPDGPRGPIKDGGGGRRITGGGGGGGGTVLKPDEIVKPDEVVKPDEGDKPDEGPSAIGVAGSIRRITPLEDGGSMLTVCFGSNSDLIVAGSAGSINGLGARVVVRGRSGRCATAFTKIDSDKLIGYKAVTFAVKQ